MKRLIEFGYQSKGHWKLVDGYLDCQLTSNVDTPAIETISFIKESCVVDLCHKPIGNLGEFMQRSSVL